MIIKLINSKFVRRNGIFTEVFYLRGGVILAIRIYVASLTSVRKKISDSDYNKSDPNMNLSFSHTKLNVAKKLIFSLLLKVISF